MACQTHQASRLTPILNGGGPRVLLLHMLPADTETAGTQQLSCVHTGREQLELYTYGLHVRELNVCEMKCSQRYLRLMITACWV